MANFPPSFLDEVLSRTDIVEIIARHVELKKSGSNLMGLCPFHHEKSPSFSVSADKQLYYCFGCGKGGGAFQFLMEHDGYPFPEAVEYLAEKAGLEVPRDTQRQPGDEERQKKAYDLLSRAADAFSRALYNQGGEKALAYIKQRGMPESIVRSYGVGYAPAGYGFMQKVIGNDNRTNAQLEAIGLLFKGDHGYGDRFRDRLMFTIRDRRGRVVGFGGRIIGEGEPKYLNSPETNWFHKSDLLYGFSEHRDTIRKEKQLIVVEGYMDVLALAAYGLKIGLAPLGTAIGERQISEIFRLCDSPVFCFDGDRAGRQAAWRALERMMPILKSELSPKFLYLPDGEDPDSLLSKEGEEPFRNRMNSEAKPVLETWLMGLKLLAGQGAEGRARMAKKADTMLATMTDTYLSQAWRQEVEQATGISLKRHLRHASATPSSAAESRSVKLNTIEERFLAGLMQKPERFRHLPEVAKNFFIDNAGVKSLYMRAFSIITDAKDSNTDIARQLVQELPDDQAMISRWVNQATVQDIEYESLLLDMEANGIRWRLKRGPDLSESVLLQKRLTELQSQQRKLTEQLNETGA
ncbi:DNA primase [Mariprofundus aestuarium]|uniref:DNA primase n=1 Tax=Mariprofundus aestuarium TaxID=1921086 RepID=A0A2K8L121_MARES|nr:DNA primase [Mariprofundus aestuarium]ATX80772.1 DNA primase [Mariprofundus aestuarium]